MAKLQLGTHWLRFVNLVFTLLLLIGIGVTIYDAWQPSKGIKSTFTAEYNKELQLFKSLTPNEQAEYLELSRDQKFIKYGTHLK